jgi:hypothetical protein
MDSLQFSVDANDAGRNYWSLDELYSDCAPKPGNYLQIGVSFREGNPSPSAVKLCIFNSERLTVVTGGRFAKAA